MPVREEAQVFGPEGSHVGILTQREGDGAAPQVACLIPNAGLIYRIGPHRFSVKLARALAEDDIPTLRFDLAGVGDSKYVGESSSARERILASMRCAFDELERTTGARRFIVMGICSGAVNAYRIACVDERVVGAFMYDKFYYRSRWTTPVYLAKRARVVGPARAVVAALRALGRRLRPKAQGEEASTAAFANLDAENPPKDEFVADVNKLVGRGVRLEFVYGGSFPAYYSYAEQFRDAFAGEPFVAKVEYRHLPMLDHMLSSLAAQRTLQSAVLEWAAGFARRRAAGERHLEAP